MLLSLHISKTAGTSFRMALQEHYGTRMMLAYRGQMRDDGWLSTAGMYRGRPPVNPMGGAELRELDEEGRRACSSTVALTTSNAFMGTSSCRSSLTCFLRDSASPFCASPSSG